jgi:MFS family permease
MEGVLHMSESVHPSNSPDEVATLSAPVVEAGDLSAAVVEVSDLPEALAVPTRSKSLGWQLALSLANLIVWMCTIPLFQILLPNQIAAFDSANKVTLLAIISLAGGITAILGNLLAGALSDRTTSRLGRRRPWIISGALLSAAPLILLGIAPGIPVVAIGVILFQFCINLDIASLAALVPDQVPVSQRATVSAFAGLALPLGSVIGLVMIAQAFNGSQTSYFVLAAILIVVIAFFVLITREAVLPKGAMPSFDLKAFLAGFGHPFRGGDFTLTLIGRILVVFGYYTVVGYLLYYLQDVVHYSNATDGVAIFQVLSTGVLIVATISSGIISDRLQRRKPFVILSSGIMALALVILAFFPVWPLVLAAAAIIGIGLGIFLSCDLALQTQVLPAQRDNGKDLSILNTANLLPQILVPIVVGIVLAIFHSYSTLFLIAAIATVIGGSVIFLVKSVR